MQINQRKIEPDIAVVEPVGRLTLGRETQAFEALVAGLIAAGERKIVLDLKLMEYLDSAGLGVILASASKARQAGGALRLAGVGGRVMQVLKITRTDAVLSLDADVATAAANF